MRGAGRAASVSRVQELRTDRLILDAPREADIEAVLAACQDPETQRWIPLPSPYTRENAEYFVRSYCPHGLASGRYTVWALHEGRTAPLAGVIEVRADEAPGSASLGCWSVPAARGRGLFREGLIAVTRHALDPHGLGFTRLRWEHLLGNAASGRLAAAAGFAFDAGTAHTVEFRGERRPAVLGVLSRDGVLG